MMIKEPNRKLILETGEEYPGYSFGAGKDKILEIVFNTSMAGYQEILSDPSYTDQAVVMTYPLIGNYGMAPEDYEAHILPIGALIVREYNDEPSNFRSTRTLADVMKAHGICGISGIDTRKLARSIRDRGSRKVMVTDLHTPREEALEMLAGYEMPHNAVARVSTCVQWEAPAEKERFRVAAIDCGMKLNIVRSLNARGCHVTVLPWNTPASVIESLQPDGVFLSNGPGDPVDVQVTIQTVKTLLGKYPLFGICLGHQIISLAYGAKTYKLKFGHRGGNHPVKDLLTGRIEVTSQNHSYAVDPDSVQSTPLEITHINLLDRTVEGVRCVKDHVMSVQYHPESCPGPQDSAYLFDEFISMMEAAVKGADGHA